MFPRYSKLRPLARRRGGWCSVRGTAASYRSPGALVRRLRTGGTKRVLVRHVTVEDGRARAPDNSGLAALGGRMTGFHFGILTILGTLKDNGCASAGGRVARGPVF
ncbi:hypothetical protein GCM10007937_41840 [Mesorhizobium albiziae]|nr:hypothetical protein GCM10007937_41840 [Mesorhizobium albiziae]